MNTTTTVRRPRPQKPVKKAPVERSKDATQAEALKFLSEFYFDAKREIKLRQSITIKHKETDDYDSVTFLGEQFSLTINFNEKFVV